MTTTKYATSDLAAAIAKEFGITLDEAMTHIDGIVDVMHSSLIEGDRIEIRGFGVFRTRYTDKTYRNPKTGEIFKGVKRRRIKFSGSTKVKDRYTETAKRLGEL